METNPDYQCQIACSVRTVGQLLGSLIKNDKIHRDHMLYAVTFAAEDIKKIIIATEASRNLDIVGTYRIIVMINSCQGEKKNAGIV